MNKSVTLSLPKHILKCANFLAKSTGRSVEKVLAETIELSLDPLDEEVLGDEAVMDWNDAEVLKTVDCKMTRKDDRRLSILLYRQQAGLLTEEERQKLTALMRIYQSLSIRKALALSEAVRRGLRGPITP